MIAPGSGEGAHRAHALNVAIGQKAAVVDGVEQPIHPLLEQAAILQHLGEMLREARVLRRGGAAEPVPRKAKAAADRVLRPVLRLAIAEHIQPRRRRRQLRGRAMLIGGADIQHLPPPGALEAGVNIRRQHGAGQIAQVLDPIDVRQGRGDQDARHGGRI